MRRLSLTVALFALASVASLGWSSVGAPKAAASSTLQHFAGGSQDEVRAFLSATPQVVYSRRIADLQAGELDKVIAEVSLTNLEDNYGGFAGSCVFTVAVDTQLILASSPGATSGIAISTPSRTSITADMHHARAVETGSYSAPQSEAGPRYVNLVASSQVEDSTCGTQSPHTRVDKGLGRLSILRYRPTSLVGASSNYDFGTVRATEAQVSSLQVPSAGQAEAVVYSAQLDGLAAGEVLEVLGNAQLLRDEDLPLDVSSRLVLAGTASATTGTVISPANTSRLAASKYGVAGASQGSLAKNGAYTVPASLAGVTRYLNLVVTGTDTVAAGSNTLQVTPGSGGLEVVRHRPNPVTGTPPAAPTTPSSPSAQVVQAEGMSVPAGSEVIADSQATPSSNRQSVRMTEAGTLSQTITTATEKTLLTLYASADICATTPGYPNGSVSEGAPIARVTVDGTVVGETQSQFDHTTTGFRALPIPVVMPAGSHQIEVAFTNPASKASPACVRRLYVDRVELSAPVPPLARLSGVETLGGESSAELTSTLPLAPNPDGSVQWRVVYSQPLVQLRQGEVIEAIGEVEVVNPTNKIVVAAGRFILADRPDQTLSEPGSSVISLNGANSDNISPEMLRVAAPRIASHTATSFHPQTKYLNLVMYAAANGAVAPDAAVNVVPDSGRLQLLRHSPLDRDAADVQPPVSAVDSGPSGLTNDSTPSFGFSSSEQGSAYQCRIDSAAFGACSGPGQNHTPSALPDGFHTFEVRATDPAGNTDATPASRSFTVDATSPVSAVDSGPTGPTNDTTPSFGFSSNEPGSGFQCRIDSASFGDCSGPGQTHTPSALPDGFHTFEVRATDPAGNTDATPASRSFTVDTTPPVSAVDSGPTGPTNDNTPSFGFSSNEPGSGFQCRIDSASFGDCSGATSHTPSALPDGDHTFEVRATDPAGNPDPTPASRSFKVDTTPPVSAVDSGPSGLTNDNTPSFGFSSSEQGSSFQCRIDLASFSACSGPGQTHTPSALSDGAHTFEVRATDPAGNTDATPASRSFTVDATPPQTQINSGPIGPTNQTSPSFGFSASETVSGFECSVDSQPFAACSGPGQTHTTSQLSEGPHTFRVRATDPAGNTDATPASRSFTVDTTPPGTTIQSGPKGKTKDNTPTFGFSSTEQGSSFRCRIDSAAFAACSGPGQTHTPSALPDGAHTFEVRATDPAGNTDATPASRSFTVDTRAPGTTIQSGPRLRTAKTTATFTFGTIDLTDDSGRFECRLDRKQFSPCSNPKRYRKLKRRKHVFRVRTIDDAGNVDPTPASRSWRAMPRTGG